MKPSPELLQQILAALSWQRELPRWQEEEFIPHASTYLHNARWEDEPPRVVARAVRPDSRGHLPPCRTHTECNKRLEREIAERKAAAS